MAEYEAFESLLNASADKIRANLKDGSRKEFSGRSLKESKTFNEILTKDIYEAIYFAGEAKSNEEYETYYHRFFDRMDLLEEHLRQHRFLTGDHIMDSDVRLFVALAGFDVAFYFGSRLNKKRLRDYDALWNYAKELYSFPAFREGTDLEAIKIDYFLTYSENPDHILPNGPDVSAWNEANNRTGKFGDLEFKAF